MSIKSAVCAVAICLASTAALAQPAPLPAGAVAGLGPVMPPQEIGKILRANGFAPQATPVRNGEAYQVRAIDRRGRQVRVAIDARYGDILMVRPIAMVPPGAYGPPPGYYHYYGDDMPTGAVGAYPPPPGAGRAAALTPAHPPIPRPKPAAKPAAVAATPSPAEAAPAAAPAASAPEAPAPAATTSPPAASPPAAAPSLPPVTPLE